MDRFVEIYTEDLPSHFHWTPYDDFKTGTTEFYVETAECLSDLGHSVIVYYNGQPTEKDGVVYLPFNLYQGKDVLLACNDIPNKLAKTNIYWTNQYHKRASDYQQFDHIICQSPYWKSVFGSDKVVIIGAGCNWVEPLEKQNLILFSSSHDRGLDFLLKIMPEVKDKTGYDFVYTSYDKHMPAGEVDHLYAISKFWVHPGQGIELFCISAVKAQSARCIPVVVPNMALKDTVKFGVFTTEEKFKDDLIKAIKNPPELPIYYPPTWEDVTREIANLFDK